MGNSGHNGEQLSLGEAAEIDTLVVGTSPSYSHAVLDAVLAQALGLAMYNAVTAQQNASAARSATVLMACSALLSLPISNVAELGGVPATDPKAAPADKMPKRDAARPDLPPAPHPAAAASSQRGSSAEHDSDQTKVDGRIADAIDQMQQAVLAPQVVLTNGAGKAYQVVAQAAAIAMQDATDALRATSIIAATAASVTMTKFLTNGYPKYLLGLTAARDMMATATDDFAKVGAAAADIVKGFPAG
jgi:Killing trait